MSDVISNLTCRSTVVISLLSLNTNVFTPVIVEKNNFNFCSFIILLYEIWLIIMWMFKGTVAGDFWVSDFFLNSSTPYIFSFTFCFDFTTILVNFVSLSTLCNVESEHFLCFKTWKGMTFWCLKHGKCLLSTFQSMESFCDLNHRKSDVICQYLYEIAISSKL